MLNKKGFVLTAADLDQKQAVAKVAQAIRAIKSDETVVIAFIGGAACGKTVVVDALKSELRGAAVLSTDDYVVGDRKYRHERLDNQNPLAKYKPELMNEQIEEIKHLSAREFVMVPERDEFTGIALDVGRENYPRKIKKTKYLVVEGDFLFYKNPDYIVYMDVPDDIRKENRLARDMISRNESDREDIAANFDLRQKTQHKVYTEPVRDIADMILDVKAVAGTGNNYVYRYNVFVSKGNVK